MGGRARFTILALATMALPARRAAAAPSVWVIDDGEKIRRDATSTPFERGEQNPVWRPGEPVRAFALRGETIALQVVVGADDQPLRAVTVDLPGLDGPGGARLDDDDGGTAGRPIERFVEHFVTVRRASGGRTPGESLGWERGAGPPPGSWVGAVPDALVPVELASPWATYPMRVEPRSNGIVWIDVTVPEVVPPGVYTGRIDVRDGRIALADFEVKLEVADARMPDPSGGATVYYDPAEVFRRTGSRAAEEQLWKLLHAHRVAPLHDATRPEDVRRQSAALDGSLYTPSRGYAGPAAGVGDGVLSVGAYGSLGDPSSPAARASLEAIAHAVAEAKLFGAVDVFLYADDENCTSPRGSAWRAFVRGSADPDVRRIRVGWTCSEEPAGQPVDVAMLLASYDTAAALEARARGTEVWVYNGVLPRTGTFLLDVDAVSPRVNGWLGAMFHVPRWFYWEATYWYRTHPDEPVDPFADPESLHNAAGDWANGDGVLLYPGRQVDAFGAHSLGWEGVIASMRLKNWRRGVEDAGYLELARRRDARRADAVARRLIPAAFGEVAAGRAAPWPSRGKPFFDARRELLDIALGRAPPTAPASANGSKVALAVVTAAFLTLGALAVGVTRLRGT